MLRESHRLTGAPARSKRQLRILAVGNMYPPPLAGGYEFAWQLVMREARARGHEVRVLTSDYREPNAPDEVDPDVHRKLRWYWDVERYEFPRLTVPQRLRLELQNAAELRHHRDSFRPDVVTWWSMGCMSLTLIEQVRRAGIPAVFVVHDDWLVYGWQHDQWIRMWRGKRRALAPVIERVCRVPTEIDVNGAGPFVFNSRYTLDRARATRLGSAAATVIHPGVDDRFLEPLPPRRWGWRLTYVGRIDRQKGIDTAIRALAHLPPAAELAVWGAGDDRYVAEMQELAGRLGVGERVRFHGWATPEQLRSAYADADAVVFPVRWEEPFGLVPLEAMGVGRPVISTARGGTAEFVKDGCNALVFDADDDVALARCVSRLADDEALRARLTDGGRQTAAEYTATRFARRTLEEIVRAAAR